LFSSTIEASFLFNFTDLRGHEYGTGNPFLVRNMQADKKLVSCTKRLYGMNSSKLVESIARAEKLSLLVLGNTLVKLH